MALSVVYFRITQRLGRPYYMWDEYLYSVLWKVEVRVTVCVVKLCCVGWWWKEGRRWTPVPAHSLLFSKSTKGAARLNVPIGLTNRYQQYYYVFSTYIGYCGRVWNLIQMINIVMYNLASRKCTSPPLLAPRLKIFKWKFTTPAEPEADMLSPESARRAHDQYCFCWYVIKSPDIPPRKYFY